MLYVGLDLSRKRLDFAALRANIPTAGRGPRARKRRRMVGTLPAHTETCLRPCPANRVETPSQPLVESYAGRGIVQRVSNADVVGGEASPLICGYEDRRSRPLPGALVRPARARPDGRIRPACLPSGRRDGRADRGALGGGRGGGGGGRGPNRGAAVDHSTLRGQSRGSALTRVASTEAAVGPHLTLGYFPKAPCCLSR